MRVMPFFDEGLVEIEQVTESAVGQAEVGQELFSVCVREFLDALQFDDDLVFDEEIDAKSLVEFQRVVRDCDRSLSCD